MSEAFEDDSKNHYVDNKKLYDCIVDYKSRVIEAKRTGSDKPPIPNYVGECIMMIAERLSHKPNFINYSFRDEMISDGIENCISYFDNFDPGKSTNPFAYFTQIIYYAFLRRILKEKKQMYVKYKTAEHSAVFDESYEKSEFEDKNYNLHQFDIDQQQTVDFIKSFEDNLKQKKRKKQKAKGIERFMEE